MITCFDLCRKLNNNIVQCSDLKCTYDIKPLQIGCHILQSFNVFFSKYDEFLNHIFTTMTFYDKGTKLNKHILQ